MRFYTYILYRPDGDPFYVGKGQGNRYRACGGNTHAMSVAKQITDNGEKIEYLLIPMETEEKAYAEEIRLITLFGRRDLGTGCLCNHSDGGEGPGNLSPEGRLKMSRLGMKHTEEAKERMSQARMGNTYAKGKHWNLSEETKEKHRIAGLGRRHSETTIQKFKDRVYSEETRKKMSDSAKRRAADPEEKVLRSQRAAGQKRQPQTPEDREKKRQAALRRWQRVREEAKK